MPITLRPDWFLVLRKAWSVRCLVALVIVGFDAALGFFDLSFLPHWLAALTAAGAPIAGLFARIVAQKELTA
jgi:hypothetical protein